MQSRTTKLPASIEITPKQAIDAANLPGLFPEGTRVYIADIGSESDVLIRAARRVHDLGYVPVPHFAARRLTSGAALEERVKAMAEQSGVTDVLVIGGGLDKPRSAFSSSMQVLETGVFDRYGITDIAIAGHPEGHPDCPDATAFEALKLKAAFAERSDARMRIVTQFGFDAEKFITWADRLRESRIDLPVHLGVAGPAKVTTLLKYAAICGVGNSLAILRKRAGALATLMTRFSPETVVEPLERHAASMPHSPIRQIHVFPFGGIDLAADWLKSRGSWHPDGTIRAVANA
ncbi:methylenetetrahydrofolate reductase [Shinella sp. BYT-45]|uniref:methylenetetrahydrofolate reductase n=1 Tax=Shinella sp. BYT-45 TaxID=3377377 RepID=UPI0039807412